MISLSIADADISPENGEDLCGFALRKGPVTGIHDRLKSRWLSISGGDGPDYLVGAADIISLSRSSFEEIRRGVKDTLGNKLGAMCLGTTHTHSGPVTVPLRHCGRRNAVYMKELKNRIGSSAVKAARSRHRAVVVRVGRGRSDWGFNRRHRGKDVPTDQEVLAISFVDPETQKPLAIIANYACHPVVLGHESNAVSADYPGYLSSYVEAETGAPCLFLNGACGDINPRNEHSVNPEEPRRAGIAIGKEVIKALRSARAVEADRPRLLRQSVRIPVHQPKSARELEGRLDMLQAQFGLAREFFGRRLERDIERVKAGRYPQFVTIELSLLTLGSELGILFVPGELFSSVGMRIKDMMRADERTLLISGFSNGSVGYLPDRQAYVDGGYEPYYANFFYDFPEFDPSVEDAILAGADALRMKWSAAEMD